MKKKKKERKKKKSKGVKFESKRLRFCNSKNTINISYLIFLKMLPLQANRYKGNLALHF